MAIVSFSFYSAWKVWDKKRPTNPNTIHMVKYPIVLHCGSIRKQTNYQFCQLCSSKKKDQKIDLNEKNMCPKKAEKNPQANSVCSLIKSKHFQQSGKHMAMLCIFSERFFEYRIGFFLVPGKKKAVCRNRKTFKSWLRNLHSRFEREREGRERKQKIRNGKHISHFNEVKMYSTEIVKNAVCVTANIW